MEECRANALLITAAKDLLAAAKAPVVKQVGAALYIGFQDEHGGWSVEVPAEMRPIVERWTASRDAAVAKAVTP